MINDWSEINNLKISTSYLDKEFSDKFNNVLIHLKELSKSQDELINFMKNNNMSNNRVKAYLKGERFQNYVDFLYYEHSNPYAYKVLLNAFP